MAIKWLPGVLCMEVASSATRVNSSVRAHSGGFVLESALIEGNWPPSVIREYLNFIQRRVSERKQMVTVGVQLQQS